MRQQAAALRLGALTGLVLAHWLHRHQASVEYRRGPFRWTPIDRVVEKSAPIASQGVVLLL
jgi:hypothetical protein